MVIAYIIHNLSVGHNCSPLSYCWFGFLIIHMVASMSSYQSMVSSYCRLPFFALALLFYCLTRICFICEAMFPSTSHSSTMKSPVTWGKDSQFAWKCLRFLQKWSKAYLSLHIDRLLPDFHAGGKTVAVLHKNSLDIQLCSLMLFMYFSLFSFLVSLSTHRHLSKAGHLDLPLK